MMDECAAFLEDRACFCGQRPQGMHNNSHVCSDSPISFNCFARTEEDIRLKLGLQQSIPGVVGGSQKVLIKYETEHGREPNLTGTKLEMNLRPDTDWYPLEPAATSFNFIAPLPSYPGVVFRLKGQSGNEVITVANSNVGLQGFLLPSPWKVEAGDRLGVDGESSIAFECTSRTKYAPADFAVVGPVKIRVGEVLSSLYREEEERFLVGIAIVPRRSDLNS
ncbi:hypothetical protein SprV_0501766500 [Sparganum proliferum]